MGHKFKLAKAEASNGSYNCAACGNSLFSAATKFDAGCGFPSFWSHLEGHVKLQILHTYGRTRTQLVCSQCEAHLGHVFEHPLTETNLRYCINHEAIMQPNSD